MPQRTKVVVARAEITRVLEAIQKNAEVAKEFRIRGNNLAFLMSGGDKPVEILVDLRTDEIRACIDQSGLWRVDRDSQQRVILRGVRDFLEGGKTVEEIAQFIETNLAVEVKSFRVAFEVLGLRWQGEPLELGDGIVGTLASVCQLEGLTASHDLRGQPIDAAAVVVVLVKAEAPDSMKAFEPARWGANDCLELVAAGQYRASFNHGPPWEVRLGSRCWTWEEGETEGGPGYSNPWMRGAAYEPARDNYGEDPRRFQAPFQPWKNLPDGDLAPTMRDAYLHLGAAMRRAPDAFASITRAWTAIEMLFASGRHGSSFGRAERAVANRFKLAVAAGTGTSDPLKLADFYLLRNRIVHGEMTYNWRYDDVGRELSPLYRHVDSLAGFCWKENLATKHALQARLNDPVVAEKARSWVESWTARVRDGLKLSVHKEVRTSWGEAFEFYQGVLKACGPAPTPPKSVSVAQTPEARRPNDSAEKP